jgi:hypothetical protein
VKFLIACGPWLSSTKSRWTRWVSSVRFRTGCRLRWRLRGRLLAGCGWSAPGCGSRSKLENSMMAGLHRQLGGAFGVPCETSEEGLLLAASDANVASSGLNLQQRSASVQVAVRDDCLASHFAFGSDLDFREVGANRMPVCKFDRGPDSNI